MGKLFGVIFFALIFQTSFAQQPPAQNSPDDAYDVISIHPIENPQGGMWGQFGEQGFRARGWSISGIVAAAYTIPVQRVVGLPKWLDTAQYEIYAKMDGSNSNQLSDYDPHVHNRRLQSLLRDRFHLRAHFEQRIMRVYCLEFEKSGSKLQPASSAGTSTTMRRGHLSMSGETVSGLAVQLSSILGTEVQDKTGDTKKYDIDLQWHVDSAPEDNAFQPELFTALKEQLGLKITTQKAPLGVLVVDSIDHPTPN
jgi:uncharacterized protein (TIGR03435 family)